MHEATDQHRFFSPERAADGDPAHLTSLDLRRCTLSVPRSVLVCENPQVLETIAEHHGGRVPVVCTRPEAHC